MGGRTRIVVAVVAGVLSAVPAVVSSLRSGTPRASDRRCPSRVISMAPHATAALFAIGAGDSLVGADTFSAEPGGASALPRLGSYLDPDLEGILALRPDLVALAPGHARLAEDMARFGIPTVTAPDTRMADVFATIRALGTATCRDDAARRVEDSLRAGLADVAERAARSSPPTAVLVVDRTPDDLRQIYVAGRDNFLSDLLAAAGARNVFADAAVRFPQVSLEPILAADPDLVIELMPGASAESATERLDAWRRLVPDLRAVRAGAIRVLTDRSIPVPGPGAVETVRLFAAAIDAVRPAPGGPR